MRFITAHVLGLALVIQRASGQHYPLSKAPLPSPHSLVTTARFFLKSNYTGWKIFKRVGLWDDQSISPAKIEIKNAGFLIANDARIRKMQLAIMSYDTFWDKFVPFQESNHFCCTHEDVMKRECSEIGVMLLPKSVKEEIQLLTVPAKSGSISSVNMSHQIRKDGIYYVMVVNCNDEVAEGSFVGDIWAHSVNGYLSAMDIPKISLYATGILVYGLMTVLWGIWCVRFRNQIILLHTLIGMVIVLSLLEQCTWYLYLSYANAFSIPSDTLLSVAILSSSVRNIATCVLILLACLGLSITRPSLETTTKAKVIMGAVALFLLDTARQVATQFHVSLDLSLLILLFCGLPTTILYTIGFIWSFQSLNSLLAELLARRQTAKHRQMSRYRSVLVFAALCFTLSTAVEGYILTLDVREIWPYEWIFTDAVPNGLFLLILGVTALIWRPNRSSRYYSYNLQLPDNELGQPVDMDRIRTDGLESKAFEVTYENSNQGGLKNPEIRAWGDIDLDLEEEDASQPTREKRDRLTNNSRR